MIFKKTVKFILIFSISFLLFTGCLPPTKNDANGKNGNNGSDGGTSSYSYMTPYESLTLDVLNQLRANPRNFASTYLTPLSQALVTYKAHHSVSAMYNQFKTNVDSAIAELNGLTSIQQLTPNKGGVMMTRDIATYGPRVTAIQAVPPGTAVSNTIAHMKPPIGQTGKMSLYYQWAQSTDIVSVQYTPAYLDSLTHGTYTDTWMIAYFNHRALTKKEAVIVYILEYLIDLGEEHTGFGHRKVILNQTGTNLPIVAIVFSPKGGGIISFAKDRPNNITNHGAMSLRTYNPNNPLPLTAKFDGHWGEPAPVFGDLNHTVSRYAAALAVSWETERVTDGQTIQNL